MNSNTIFAATGFVIGAGISALITWRVTKKYYDDRIDDEIEQVKVSYDVLAKQRKTGPYSDPSEIAEKYRDEKNVPAFVEQLKDLGYSSQEEAFADPDFDKEAFLARNLADENPADEDEPYSSWVVKEDRSNPNRPYVITYEEFSEDHLDFEKVSISYYEEDDTLADEREEPIPNLNDIIGDESVERFGDRSHDPNVVYVRNERLSLDFEVTRNPRSYLEAVLGIKEEKPKVRKMRKDDD